VLRKRIGIEGIGLDFGVGLLIASGSFVWVIGLMRMVLVGGVSIEYDIRNTQTTDGK
jgi:hypothetical protein